MLSGNVFGRENPLNANEWYSFGFSGTADVTPKEDGSILVAGYVTTIFGGSEDVNSYTYSAKLNITEEGCGLRVRADWINHGDSYREVADLKSGIGIFPYTDKIEIQVATESGVKKYSFDKPDGYNLENETTITIKDDGKLIVFYVNGTRIAVIKTTGSAERTGTTPAARNASCYDKAIIMKASGDVIETLNDSIIPNVVPYAGFSSSTESASLVASEYSFTAGEPSITEPTTKEPETSNPKTLDGVFITSFVLAFALFSVVSKKRMLGRL